MNIDFELWLTVSVFISGIISLLDVLIWAPKRRQAAVTKMPLVIEYSRSFFPILLLVLVLRSFVVEPFRIPSGSEKPDLLVGDFIVANKFTYGFRLPVSHTKIIKMGEPKVGDVVVFLWPNDPSIYFIKRVVGVPGDHISYVDKVLYINGVRASQELLGETTDGDRPDESWPVLLKQEDLVGLKHKIYIRPDVPARDFSVTVPPGHYFMMGDNRDDSNDSRYWGFVPEENLIGKAVLIFFSWDGNNYRVRWDRIGEAIH